MARARRLLGAALAALLAACGGGGASPGRDLDTGAPVVWACSGADLSALSSRVHVSTQGKDDAACGSPNQTCATIQQGIARCAATGCGVLVRHGLYATQSAITLRDGIGVFGSCRAADEPERGYRTTIEANPKVGDPAIVAAGIATPTRVSGLVVVVADRAVGEGASIAMRATSSPGLTLTRMVLASGRGGDGAGGSSDAAGGGEPGNDGQVGHTGPPGGRACSAVPRADGRGTGGNGGDGSEGTVNNDSCALGRCTCGYRNPVQSIGGPGAPSGSSPGGNGGHDHAYGGYVCWNAAYPNEFRGDDGGAGNAGACARQAGPASPDLWGSVTAQTRAWTPGAGGGGAAGDVGSGGGGGTSGGFCLMYNPLQFVPGVPAGSGGGGGCGGSGGGGGQQGGASIALLLVGASARLEAQGVALVPGSGGTGGAGGNGTVGGQGGVGGQSGPWGHTNVEGYMCPGQSGRGGTGGDGGSGAGGAGGNGGPSINLALTGGALRPGAADDAYAAMPGLGGRVGSGRTDTHCSTPSGAAGVGGGAATVVDLDRPPSNVLSVGQALAPGDTRISPSGRYQLTLQIDGNLCLRDGTGLRWCSEQQEHWLGSTRLVMQADGNLCLYDANGKPSCSETTLGHPGAYLAVEDDGQIVVREGSLVLWSRPRAPS